MSLLRTAWLLALVIALGWCGGLAAQEVEGGGGARPESEASATTEEPGQDEARAAARAQALARREAQRAEKWRRLVERDGRVGFTQRTEHDARSRLLEPTLTDGDRAVALMALGCARPEALRELGTLERAAASGPDNVRLAAVLALGELGVGVEAILEDYLDADEPRLRAAAMLGLLRSGLARGRELVSTIAEGDGRDAALARDLLVGAVDPAVSRPTGVGELRYELRWLAAQRFGLIDGVSWKLRNLERLLEQPAFLDGVVLRAASTAIEPGVRDHILTLLLERGGSAALRAATRAMPDELAALIANDLYIPAGARDWAEILLEIDEAGTEGEALALLELSLDVPEVALDALFLLARAGLDEVLEGLEEEWADLSPPQRLRALEAWGQVDRRELRVLLADYEKDATPRVRAGVLVARARLGDEEAEMKLAAILADGSHPDFAEVLSVTLRVADAVVVRRALQGAFPAMEGPTRVTVATELALRGDLVARDALAEELREALPAGRQGARAVRALRGHAAGLYVDLFVKYFPVEDDLEVNIELALALIDAKATRSLLFLRPALWSDPFDRSVLAALLVTRVAGMHGLRDELERPPVEASSRDLRRVGFALGEWGGVEVIETLMTRGRQLRGRPVLQGAVLGALGRRTH